MLKRRFDDGNDHSYVAGDDDDDMMIMMMVMNTLHKMTMPMILKIVLFNFVKMTC